jgi:hypothetical protein
VGSANADQGNASTATCRPRSASHTAQPVEAGGGGVQVEFGAAAELTRADVSAPERVRHRLDPANQVLELCRVCVQRPAAEELDLDHPQAGVGGHGLHPGDVEPGRDRPGEVVGVQPDPGEARSGCRAAALREGMAGLLAEAGAGQGEETGDQVMAARRVSHGRLPPRP